VVRVEQVIDARDPNQVSSARVIEADLGVHNRRLLVISGIAIYNWRVDTDQFEYGEVRVKLGVYARELEQASPFVGLATIGNGESEFAIGIFRARVDLDPDTGELSLYARTVLSGEWSELYRFAYQVVATVVHVGTFIEGTITWPTSLRKPPSEDPSTIAPHVSVVANHRSMKEGQGPWAASEDLTPVTPGVIDSLQVREDQCEAHYRIDNPPLGMPLKVTATPSADFPDEPRGTLSSSRTSGPDVFTLSLTESSQVVDFAISRVLPG
jgi:hypothetical protein